MPRQLIGLVIWLFCSGFSAEEQAQYAEEANAYFDQQAVLQTSEKTVKGKYTQDAEKQSGALSYQTHVYDGPNGVGYTQIAILTQTPCDEHPDGEPCVWRYFRHDGPELERDKSELTWMLKPLEKE